jgi:DNA-binding CsgD family transcriptional regulator
MAKSIHLRGQDWRAIVLLVGECRELGDEQTLRRRHLLGRLSVLVDADLGFCGEMGGILSGRPRDLGFTDCGYENGFDRAAQIEVYTRVEGNPGIYDALSRYSQRLGSDDGICVSARESLEHETWESSTSYQLVHRPLGVDHALWCYRSLSEGNGDEFSALQLQRADRRRDFTARDRSLVREVQSALTPMIGGPLARVTEPTPMALPPSVRRVLACILEGDGDKQIAARLGLSIYTVNDYTKTIYRHFGVQSRSQLLARWIRRGWPSLASWAE